MCETAYVARYPFTNDQEVNEPDWELFIKETARQIVQQQSVERIMAVRDRLYELLCHCIPADVIFKVFSLFLLKTWLNCSFIKFV
jgi:replication factor C subunit 3/5